MVDVELEVETVSSVELSVVAIVDEPPLGPFVSVAVIRTKVKPSNPKWLAVVSSFVTMIDNLNKNKNLRFQLHYFI